MKLRTFLTAAALCSVILFTTNCKKAIEDIVNPKGKITYSNPTSTTITLVANGQTKTIPPGGSAEFTGTPSEVVSGTASTSGLTASGSVIGVVMSWNIYDYFPSGGGSTDIALNVGSEYFYLKMINTSTKVIQKLYVNYGTVGQTLNNITIPNDGLTYTLGYFNAYSNSNVRAESGTTYWFWNPLNLPFSNNQIKTLTAN